MIGGSAYLGDSGQNQEIAGERPDVFTQIYEGHGQLRWQGLELRALGVVSDIDDADLLSRRFSEDEDLSPQTIAEQMVGYYFEGAYDVLPLVWLETTHYLAPWIRYSEIDTQDEVPAGFPADPNRDRQIIEVGLSYKPIPQVVFKLDYRNFAFLKVAAFLSLQGTLLFLMALVARALFFRLPSAYGDAKAQRPHP